MDLYETELWHPGMIDALVEARRGPEAWTHTDELLATLIQETRLVRRQIVVNAGGEDPGPVEITRPGEKSAPQVPAWKQAFSRLAGGVTHG